MKEVIKKVSEELNIPYEVVDKTYKAFWLFIRQKIQALPLKEEPISELSKLKHNFNLPSLGKLYCDLEKLEFTKKSYNDLHKEN